MPEGWKQWEGRVVNEEFPLLRYLGGSERTAVFLSKRADGESQEVAIKLVVANAENPELQLSWWELAAKLSHPHLLRLFRLGRCQLDGTDLLYVVTEYAEESLAQILPYRALTPAEAQDMLRNVVDALSYIHGKGFRPWTYQSLEYHGSGRSDQDFERWTVRNWRVDAGSLPARGLRGAGDCSWRKHVATIRRLVGGYDCGGSFDSTCAGGAEGWTDRCRIAGHFAGAISRHCQPLLRRGTASAAGRSPILHAGCSNHSSSAGTGSGCDSAAGIHEVGIRCRSPCSGTSAGAGWTETSAPRFGSTY